MGERDPEKISLNQKRRIRNEEVIMFPLKGKTETVTPAEAMSIINYISGSLMAYEHSGGYSEYERKYLSGIPDQEG